MVQPLPIRPPSSTPRVLIVDDSAVARTIVGRMIEGSGRFAVAAAVASVADALSFLARASVQFILLDIAMPDMDGISALPRLIAACGGAKIIIVSASAGDGAAATVQALALGAADTLVKPGTGTPIRFAEVLIEKLDRLVDHRPQRPGDRTEPTAGERAPAAGASDYDIVGIGASTGGIHALGAVLRELPARADAPILVTQHLPATFMPYFAAQLAVLARRPCEVATDHQRIRRGRILVAPGDAHLVCARSLDGEVSLRLSTAPAKSGCLPSADPMFSSLAAVYGARALGIVLSGMGRDGAEGARDMHKAGAALLVQDEASSVVWGMPRAVASQGLAAAVLPPDAIGRLLASQRFP